MSISGLKSPRITVVSRRFTPDLVLIVNSDFLASKILDPGWGYDKIFSMFGTNIIRMREVREVWTSY